MAFTPDSQHVLSAAGSLDVREGDQLPDDCTIRMWDVGSGRETQRLKGHTQIVRSVVVTRDGRRAVSGSDDGTVRIWDLQTGREIHRFQDKNGGGVNCVALTPDDRRILTAEGNLVVGPITLHGSAYSLRLWEIAPPALVRSFGRQDSSYERVAIAPDGHTAISTASHAAILWNLETGEEVRRLEGYDGGNGGAFTHDGSQIATGGQDSAIHLWNVNTGKEQRRLEGHTHPIWSLAVSVDGKRLISTEAYDFSVRLWDVDSGKELQRFVAGPNAPTCVALSPDGKLAVTASSLDSDVILWGLPE